MTTRVLDLRGPRFDPGGILGRALRYLELTPFRPVGPATHVIWAYPEVLPRAAARKFMQREETLPPGRLDLVIAQVGTDSEASRSADDLRAVGDHARRYRTDGTFGLLCLAPLGKAEEVRELVEGPYDFVLCIGTEHGDEVPRIVGGLEVASESLNELRGAYEVGTCRLEVDEDVQPFDVAADLSGRWIEPLRSEYDIEPPESWVMATPERFVAAVREGVRPARLLGWQPCVDEVRAVGFYRVS